MDDTPDDLESLAATYRATLAAFRPIWFREQEPVTGREAAEHHEAVMRLARAIQGRGWVVIGEWRYEGEVVSEGRAMIHSQRIGQTDS